MMILKKIMHDERIAASNKSKAIFWGVHESCIGLDKLEAYLRSSSNHKATDYRRLLCLYDFLKYGVVE